MTVLDRPRRYRRSVVHAFSGAHVGVILPGYRRVAPFGMAEGLPGAICRSRVLHAYRGIVQPGPATVLKCSNGGILHLPIDMLNTQAGITLTHVPYKVAAPAVIEVVAGLVQGMFVDLPVILPHVKAAKLRVIAVASPKRSVYLTDVPTMKESGFPGIEVSNYYSLLLPQKTP
jgi:hypothetical protein